MDGAAHPRAGAGMNRWRLWRLRIRHALGLCLDAPRHDWRPASPGTVRTSSRCAHCGAEREELTCPSCAGPALRVVYWGLPSRLCASEECGLHWGWGQTATAWLPFTGFFLPYAEGSYWPALWRWIRRMLSAPCEECEE